MRTLAITILLFTLPAFAAQKSSFKISLAGKYGSTWYEIHQEKGKWICKSNTVPYYEARTNPLDRLDWKRIEKPTANLDQCRDKVFIEDTLQGSARKTQGCFTERRFGSLFEKINAACRSEGLLE